jgi:hypothetical protein
VLSVSCDHISLLGSLENIEDLGFVATTTQGADGRHARVFLDRMYIELDVVDAGPSSFTATGWFLRPTDLEAAASALAAAGLDVRGPERYEGHDGRWVDVSFLGGGLDGASPILTARVDMPRGSWPPEAPVEHPNGVTTIGALELEMPDPERAMRTLSVLGAVRSAAAMSLEDGSELLLRNCPGLRAARIAAVRFRRVRGDDLVIDIAGPLR